MLHRRPLVSSLVAAAVLALLTAASALGAPAHRTVQVLDNCDGPTFNAFLGPDACTRPSGMTVETFLALLEKGGAQSWRFSPGYVRLAAGGTVTAVNRGGEFHTFTKVAAFGGGCVPPLNVAVGQPPVPECGDPSLFGTTGLAAGASLTTEPLPAGTAYFMCLIHPWQRTTVVAD